ncbi:MAG: hypothetical protein ACR2OC_10240, partial [Solirubrobacterales bacterium]
MTPKPPAAFYSVADERYFLGAVGMINSLRLHGHDEPILLVDCGLTTPQRELLAGETTIVPAPEGVAPYLLKTVAPSAHPARVMVLIDTDMIVTRSLGGLIEEAAQGRVIAFENDSDRFVAEWGEALELGPIGRRPYVSVGLVLCGGEPGAETIRLLDDRQRRVDMGKTFYGSDEADYPFKYPEQDVLNAILSTRIAAEAVTTLPSRLMPNQPFDGLALLDEASLRCGYADGIEPYVLHHYLFKPWLEPMYHGLYSRLLARCLLGPGLAIRVPEADVPLRFREGALARLERARVGIPDLVGWKLRGVFPERVVKRIDERRRRRSAKRGKRRKQPSPRSAGATSSPRWSRS